MGKLKFKDLYLGKIDGYNEFLEYGQDICKELFYEYPNFDLNKILNGSVYYICGDKGTGKTMLLKYIESVVNEDSPLTFTEFVRFKKDIDENQRNLIKRASLPDKPFEEIIESDIPMDSTIDCILAWQVYLIKLIVYRLDKTEYGVFDRNDPNWSKLKNIITAVYDEAENTSIVKKILPKIKKGNIEINIGKYGKLDLDIEWSDKTSHMVSFSVIAGRIVDLYSSLVPVENKIYILVDELELSLKMTKKYLRDITLIRDLIFAIQYMCEISKMRGFNVHIIAAIRNEVYTNVLSKGLEINKTIHDFGTQISWQQKGGDIKEHPLLKMLEKRILYSERMAGIEPSQNVWKDYFTPTIGRSKIIIQNYILDQTWYKPRDIIRMFSIIQNLQGEKNYADQEMFEVIRQSYSSESWTEFEETLTVTYSDKEVEGIRHALTGIKLPFELKDFIAQIDGKVDTFEEVELLKKSTKKPSQILRSLYDVGVIGNYGSLPRFVFKGNKDIDPMQPYTLHYPLIRFFRASIKAYEKKLSDYQ